VNAFRRLLFFALFLTFDLIMFGTFVRVTDAGLGCPDWPGCYGKVTPFGAIDSIRAEAAARPQGPVTEFKAWVEMLHRYIAAGLGVLVIAIAVMATRIARRPLTDVKSGGMPGVALAWLTLAWIVLQGVFGAWTVTLKLKPLVVTAHLLGGMVLFGLLLAQAVRVAGHPRLDPRARRLTGWAALALGVLFVQIALGGWVSTNYATLACRDFPTCQGSWWPPMDFEAGFELWRRLGVTGDGGALPFQALTAIHVVHRLFAFVVFAVVGGLAWRMHRLDGLTRVATGLAGVLALQLATGLTNIFLDWPLIAAVLHTGGAAALMGLLLMVNFRVRAAGSMAPAAATESPNPAGPARPAPASGPAVRAGA
jgi:cytochrome c oxidase assembly protein subunit 15